MEIESQVCSLELAKQLKELGVKQESVFQWVWNPIARKDASVFEVEGWQVWYEGKPDIVFEKPEWYSAFTVAGFGEILPGYVKNWKWHDLDKAGREYWNCESERYHAQEQANTEADARAEMVVYLLENGLLGPQSESDTVLHV